MSGKWLELLRQIAPNLTRVGVLGMAKFRPSRPHSPPFKPRLNRSA